MGEYADLFDEAPKANLALRFGIEANPDQAAEAARLARRYRLPVGVVKEFRQDYADKAKADDAKIVVDQSPVLKSWIAKDQQNADISHDDVGNLSAVASAVRMAGSFGEGAIGQGGIGSALTGLSKLNEIAGRGITNVLSSIGGDKVREVLETDIPWWLDPTKVLLERPGQVLKDIGKSMAPEQKLFREDVAGGLGQFAGQAATALLTGGAAASGTMFAQGVDAMSEKVANDPASQAQKDSATLVGAGVTAVTEKYALDKILGPMAVPIKNAIAASLARIGIGAATEGAQEIAESIGQDVARMLVTDSNASIDALSTAYEGGVGATVGGIARSVVEAALHVKQRGDRRTIVAAQAEQTKESLQGLDELAKASKVRERDAVTFEQFVEHASEDGPVQDVFISGDALMQSGLLNQLAQVSPSIAEQAQTAAATGGDVRIPIAEYAARIAGTDLSGPLLDHLKTSANGLSQAEAKEYIKDQGERLKADVESALGGADAQSMAGRDAVQTKVLEKLNAVKRFTPDVNTLYATQMANFFAVQAQRTGTTPEALFAQFEPSIVAEGVTGPSLSQAYIEPDDSGLPQISGDGVFVGFAQPAERIEFIPGDSGEQMLNMAIMSPDGQYQGYIEATFKNGKPVAIYDIDVSPETRGSGVGAAAVKALLDTTEGGKLEVSNILPQAQGFWEKLGIGVQNVEEGATYDGTITTESFAASPAGKKRRATSRDAQGNAATRAGSEGAQSGALNQLPQAQIETAEFKRWFGDSKVVDKFGKPLVVYHGTNKSIYEFHANGPVWFSVESSVANEFVAGGRQNIFAKPRRGSAVYPVYIAIKNPLDLGDMDLGASVSMATILRRAGAPYDEGALRAIAQSNLDSGYASVSQSAGPALDYLVEQSKKQRLSNMLDSPGLVAALQRVGVDGLKLQEMGSTTYAAFKPTQIKSAIGNRGTFDPNDPSILNQGGVKPNATFSPDTRTIALLKGANLTSFLHESAHFYLEVLTELARTSPAIRQDMDAILKWFGITGSESVGRPGDGAPLEQAAAQTETAEFKRWFGNSKVADANGKPLVVYHGSSEDVSVLAPESAGTSQLPRTGKQKVVWFTDSAVGANFYTDARKSLRDKYRDHIFPVTRDGKSTRLSEDEYRNLLERMQGKEGAVVYPAYLSMQNPMVFDAKGRVTTNRDRAAILMREIKAGNKFDGLIVHNTRDANEEQPVETHYAVLQATQIKSAIGNRGTFDPNDPNILNQGGPETEPGPLPSGRTPFETWELMTLDEKRPFHEKWARGFEAYLFEGKAPSQELQGPFARFKAWMVSWYKTIKALNVELTDEVRSVFDRMLASPEQIEAAQASREMGLMFASEEEARKFGVDWAAYQAKGKQSTDQAISELDKKSLADMQWLSKAKSRLLKDLQKRNDGLRKEVEREVRSEVMTRPVYRAWAVLTAKEGDDVRGPDDAEAVAVGRAKLNTEELKERYGIASDADWRRLSALRMTSPEGVSPDSLSEQVGFTSGDEMVKALIDAVPPQEVIKAETDQRMLERYGDITSDEALAAAVDEAVHNDMRQRVVADELAALEKAESAKESAGVDKRGRQRSVRTLPKAAKEFAQNLIASIKIRDLRPAQYSTAAARAGVMALRALKKNDIAEAAKQKRNQLIQGYASKAASQAQEEVSDGLDYLRKVDKSQSIDQDYKDQIDTILERFDLKRGTSLKTIDKRKALSEWIAQQEEIGISPDLPAEVTNEALRKSYKDMTVDEFRGLVDSVRQIEHLGRLKKKLLTAKDKRDFEAARDELVASIDANAKTKVDNRTRDTLMSGAIRLFNGYFASHRKTASLAKELDGFKDGGPMWEYLVRTMNEAGDTEAVMREQATFKLMQILKPILKDQKLTGKGQFFSSVGLSLNRGERLVMALNTGNAGNLQRLLDGRGWNLQQIQPVMDSLTEQDWQAVQAIWDFFEGYRPMIAAKERRVMGKEPDWVDPTPVVTKFGTFKGGYYPIKYDPRESGRAENFANAEQAKQELKGAFVASTTRRSFTKTRAEEVSGRPLLLTMDAIFSGANEVIHDLSWHEWVIDANRILRNDQIDKAIRDGYGADTAANLKQAVKDIAAGEATQADALSRVLSPLRAGATIAGLGLNLTNAMLQPLGLTQSMVRVGARWVGLGIAEWAKSPVGLVKQVHAKSDFMRLRAKTQQRELNEIASVVKGKSAVRAKLDTLMFVPMTSMQLVADMPTWWGAYQKALANGDQEERAIEMADQAVIDAQGGGQVKDLSAIQRGGPLLKLFTTFYGYFNVAYNLGVERTKATNFRDPLDIMHLAWDFLLLYSAPAVLATLVKEGLTGGGDDEEALARKVIDEQISFLMGTMVGLREATGAMQYAAGTKQFDMAYGGPAGLRFVQELDKLGKQIGQGELDRALVRAGVNVAGVVLHLPSGQVNKTIDGVIAISEGKTENPSAILFGPPKE